MEAVRRRFFLPTVYIILGIKDGWRVSDFQKSGIDFARRIFEVQKYGRGGRPKHMGRRKNLSRKPIVLNRRDRTIRISDQKTHQQLLHSGRIAAFSGRIFLHPLS